MEGEKMSRRLWHNETGDLGASQISTKPPRETIHALAGRSGITGTEQSNLHNDFPSGNRRGGKRTQFRMYYRTKAPYS